MAANLVAISGSLASVAGQLVTDANGAPCCCGGECSCCEQFQGAFFPRCGLPVTTNPTGPTIRVDYSFVGSVTIRNFNGSPAGTRAFDIAGTANATDFGGGACGQDARVFLDDSAGSVRLRLSLWWGWSSPLSGVTTGAPGMQALIKRKWYAVVARFGGDNPTPNPVTWSAAMYAHDNFCEPAMAGFNNGSPYPMTATVGSGPSFTGQTGKCPSGLVVSGLRVTGGSPLNIDGTIDYLDIRPRLCSCQTGSDCGTDGPGRGCSDCDGGGDGGLTI